MEVTARKVRVSVKAFGSQLPRATPHPETLSFKKIKTMEEIPVPYPELTAEQKEKVAELSEKDLSEIDKVILSNSSKHWRKQAMIIVKTMNELEGRFSEIPDIYYAECISRLVKEGYLESQGNLKYIRFSEIRLPKLEKKNKNLTSQWS